MIPPSHTQIFHYNFENRIIKMDSANACNLIGIDSVDDSNSSMIICMFVVRRNCVNDLPMIKSFPISHFEQIIMENEK